MISTPKLYPKDELPAGAENTAFEPNAPTTLASQIKLKVINTAETAEKSKDIRVLIVDDEKDICKIFNRVLTRANVYNKTANSIKEALDLLANENFDLIFLDFNLRDGTALDLIERIAQPGPEIIIMTGEIMQENSYHGLEVLPKPFPLHAIIDIINQIKQEPAEKAISVL